MPAVTLDRSTFHCTGADATDLLERIVTCAVQQRPTYGALLTPQGKVLFDFILTSIEGGYRFDCARNQCADLMKRLAFYRLRADVTLTETDEPVAVGWQEASRPDDAFDDPRLPELGWRSYAASGNDDVLEWAKHRIEHGIPEPASDGPDGGAFPHDLSFDQYPNGSGVAFDKGCYVGQEVVSRMQHRGTARSRIVQVSADEPLPETGSPVLNGDREIGRLGTVAGHRGLALVRLDRLKAANDAGDKPTIGGMEVEATIPAFASYDYPK